MNVDAGKLTSAITLLRDENLVWSADFDAIREPLKKLLLALVTLGSSGTGNLGIQTEITEHALSSLLDALIESNA